MTVLWLTEMTSSLSEITVIMIGDLRAYFTMKRGRMELRERKYQNNLKNKILAIKRNEVRINATMWINLENIILSERRRIQNTTSCKFLCMKCLE